MTLHEWARRARWPWRRAYRYAAAGCFWRIGAGWVLRTGMPEPGDIFARSPYNSPFDERQARKALGLPDGYKINSLGLWEGPNARPWYAYTSPREGE